MNSVILTYSAFCMMYIHSVCALQFGNERWPQGVYAILFYLMEYGMTNSFCGNFGPKTTAKVLCKLIVN